MVVFSSRRPMPSREELEQLIAKWRSEVNPGCHFCAMHLEALLDKKNEEEKSNV